MFRTSGQAKISDSYEIKNYSQAKGNEKITVLSK